MKINQSKNTFSEEPEQSVAGRSRFKKQFWLHIGFPKTGTTSIQSVLTQASDHIMESGSWYPRLGELNNREQIANSHHSLFRALTQPEPDDDLSERRTAEADLTAMIEKFSNDPQLLQLIVSHEGFSENVRTNFELLRRLTERYPSTIIAYVRYYDQWIESRYAQYVRECKGQVRPIERLYLGDVEPCFFLRRLQAFRDQLPSCRFVVRSLDTARGSGLVEDFLRQTGIQNDSVMQSLIDAKGTTNRGRLPIVNFFKAYATAGSEGSELASLLEDCLKAIGNGIEDVPFANEPFGFLSCKLKRRARRLYQQEVKLLCKKFGAQIPDPPSLSAAELRYSTRLSKRQYQETLNFFRPYLDERSADRLQAAFEPGAAVMDNSRVKFLRRLWKFRNSGD